MTLTAEPRCATAFLESTLPIIGSAPVDMSGWILLEHPGPWPKKGLPDDLDADLRAWLDARPERVQLIRHLDRRGETRARRVFVSSGFGRLASIEVRSLNDLTAHLGAIEAASSATVAGAPTVPVGFTPTDDVPLLVCTQGPRDICCALLGRPATIALAEAFGNERVWETNHLGGHRFAANLVVPPLPYYLGQISPEHMVENARELLAGRLPLATLRGRAGIAEAAQAAEYFVRLDQGLTELGDVVEVVAEGESWLVRVADGRGFLVDIVASTGPELPASCGADPEPQVTFDLGGMRAQ